MLHARSSFRRVATAILLFLSFALGPALAQDRGGALSRDSAVGQLYELARGDFRTSATVRRLEADKDYFATNPNARSSLSAEERRKLVALARNPDVNRVLTEAALSDLRARSRAVRDALIRARSARSIDRRYQVWDVIVVGAGVHDQIFNNIIGQENPRLKVLTIEENDRVASNFALANLTGRINSSNRPSNADEFPRPGVGNLNEFPGGPVQVPDVSAVKYPPFRTLADVATVNRAASSADILFNQIVSRVEDRGLSREEDRDEWPARYRVTLGDLSVLYTEVVVFSTGLGTPSLPNVDEKSKNFLQEFLGRDEILTYQDFIRKAASSRNPYRPYAGKKIAVVGSGDSGKVAIEWLLRLGPDEGYGDDTAQIGLFEKIYWVGQDKTTCDDYIQNVRVRYADIAGGIKNGSVVAVPGRLVQVYRTDTGKIRIRTDDGDGISVDVVILATGFRSRIEQVLERIVATDKEGRPLGPRNPITSSSAVMPIVGRIGTQEPDAAKTVTIGQKLAPVKGRSQQVYFAGAAVGEIVQASELRGVTENKKSIFALGPRTAAIGELIAKRKPIGGDDGDDGARRFRLSPSSGDEGRSIVIGYFPLAQDNGSVNGLSDLLLEAKLKSALRRELLFSSDLESLELKFRRTAKDGLTVSFSEALGKAGADRVLQAIAGEAELVGLLYDVVGTTSDDPSAKITLKLARGPRGTIDTSERMRIVGADTDGMSKRVRSN